MKAWMKNVILMIVLVVCVSVTTTLALAENVSNEQVFNDTQVIIGLLQNQSSNLASDLEDEIEDLCERLNVSQNISINATFQEEKDLMRSLVGRIDNGTLQLQLQAAIDNKVDEKFINLRDRIEQTLLPSQQEKDALKERALVLEKDLGICQQNLLGKIRDLEQDKQNFLVEKEQLEDRVQTWMIVSIGLCGLLVLIVVLPWWKSRTGT